MQKIDISPIKNKKIAIVLSGGVVKASAWHLGVALALNEMGLVFKHNNSPPNPDYEISTYVGSSAGALMNLYFACGYLPIEIIEATILRKKNRLKPISYKEMFGFRRPKKKPLKSKAHALFNDWPLLTRHAIRPFVGISGFFSTQGLYNYIHDNLLISDRFEDYAADMFVVATQLDHSRKVIFNKYNYPTPINDPTSAYYTQIPVSEAIAASMSVPPIYSPYPVENRQTGQTDYYIDGEIRETLSSHVAIDNKCDLIISSWTHTPYHYHDEIGSLISYGLPAILLQSIYLMIQKKIMADRSKIFLAKDVLDTVSEFMKNNNIPENHRKQLLSILERKLDFNPNIKLIDICPRHDDFKFFFRNSFSLNPQSTSEIVTTAYERTFEIFKNTEWKN